MGSSHAADNELEVAARTEMDFAAGAVACIGLIGAGAAISISIVARAFTCEDAGDSCAGGTALVAIACLGLVPPLGMLVASARPRGHPWYWFVTGAFIYGFWAVVFMSLAG
jgi:hypothetical protein